MSQPEETATITAVANLIGDCDRILFITGAGISVASGLPTYRGIGGLYEGKVTEDGMRIEEALSGPMLKAKPEITWKYLWEIADAVRGKRPNRAHEILAQLEPQKSECWVLTQNVDGLHHEAGTRNLIEIHGRASHLFCIECDFEAEGETFLYGGKSTSVQKPNPPECPRCGGLVRPDVVLFGEMLPETQIARMEALLAKNIELVVSIGTSSLFPYITAPVEMAQEHGLPTVEINAGRTDLSDSYDYRIELDAAEAMERIWRSMGNES